MCQRARCRSTDVSRRRAGHRTWRKLLRRSARVNRHRAAFAFPDFEAALADAIFSLLAQVIEEVSGAEDDAGDRSECEEDAHHGCWYASCVPFCTNHAKPT